MKKFSFKKLGKFFVAAGLVACCLTLSACAGMPKDLLDEIENNPDLSEEEKEQLKEDLKGGISLNGVKVLRKPLTYDFAGDGSWNEGDTDFYHHFANNIITELFYNYGNFNSAFDSENIYAYYSSKMPDNEWGNADKEFWNDLSTDFQKNKESYKYYYDAFRYPIASESEVKQMVDTGTSEGQVEQVVGYEVTIDQNRAWNWTLELGDETNRQYQPWLMKNTDPDKINLNKYNYDAFQLYYSGDGSDVFDAEQFSTAYINNNYINALTYAVYSIVLGLPTGNIQVNVNTENGIPDVTINNMAPQDALSEVKATYNRLGTYVGLTDNDKAGVIDFIHHNVIGDEAWSGGQNALYDLRYDSIVPALVRYCSTLTQIGKTDGFEGENDENSTIGDPFMASEIADFPATSFFSSMDGDPFEYSEGAFDYQSMVLMPSRDNVELTDIWLDFMYQTNDDNTPTGQYIDIEVVFRWYKGDGVAPAEVKRTIRVYDGPPDVGEDNTTLECELDTADGFGDAVKINKFIEPTALKTDKEHNYIKTIKGTDEARKYYTVVQSGSYNAYGVLDYTKIEGSYLEIAFNVKKTAGSDKNYNFSVAISNLMEKGGNQDEHIVD